jgi:DNA-binding HxlR family transcriptional regulator
LKAGTIWFISYLLVHIDEKSGNLFSRKSVSERSARMVETIFGCKWSLTVYQLLANGINRPGEMVRNVEGLSTKVLNDCLRKNTGFGILERISYDEVPPRVEYKVTPFGSKFIRILDELERLQDEIREE